VSAAAVDHSTLSPTVLITGALICILMYACRSESHVQTANRNQRAMNYQNGGGQSAMIYGRSGHDMEMTRRSRY
jgi:hypothetical protein